MMKPTKTLVIPLLTMNARNTILANNTAPFGTPDLAGSLGSWGYDLIGNSSGGRGYDQTG